jgi:hypothetical protein
MSDLTDAISARVDERQRVLDIVRKQIGLAALGDDVPNDFPTSWFRELYESIQEEVRNGK